ncbi:probable aquaporin TIP5-1 [Punica granatum]|uniref:Probable aquaporin TIP5-1 n=1 Tax=Punica granatum TaxID=22663 RepID=A0A6P8CJH2_PUNGR|nr:probable aquaporin TIP5-1 [Punica granatum]
MAPSALAARFGESVTKSALRSYLAEFISTFFFVIAAVGSAMSSRKMLPDAMEEPAALVVVAVANAFALSSAIYIAGNISGGHVNPAVTFAMAIGGRISVPTAIFYWISQMLASIMACILLKGTTAGQAVPSFAISQEMTGFGSSILEGVLTFALVYTVYATGDPRNSPLGATGPIMVGFVAGAGVLATGPLTGGSMNPACAFGSALVAGSFRNQAVYWIGPLVGAMAAGLLYDNAMIASQAQDLPPPAVIRGFSEGVRA